MSCKIRVLDFTLELFMSLLLPKHPVKIDDMSERTLLRAMCGLGQNVLSDMLENVIAAAKSRYLLHFTIDVSS